MKEDFLHCLWKHGMLSPEGLQTVDGESIIIMHPGRLNTDSGPDFFAAKLRINNTIWVGNVEIHVKASDWNKHGHHLDGAYDNIILHVVHHHDKTVLNSKGETLPTLEVRNNYNPDLLKNYLTLQSAKTWIACQNSIFRADKLIIGNWLNRLLVERLESKTQEIARLLHYFSNHWENTCYYLLAKNFGFKTNATPFALLAQKTPRAILMKYRNRPDIIEAILFGQAGMLGKDFTEAYPQKLKKEYDYQQKLHGLIPLNKDIWKFARMRPVNFPTLRMAQFAMLIQKTGGIFRKIVESKNTIELSDLFAVNASDYWNRHYRFEHPTEFQQKCIGKDCIQNILINTVAPLLFIYGKENMNGNLCEKAIQILQALPPENNHIIREWANLGIVAQDAADSQALLELKKFYCTPKKCLKCPIGYRIIFHQP